MHQARRQAPNPRLGWAWAVGWTALVLAGCANPVPEGTGIEGTVWLGPQCPVQRDPPETGCEDRPYETDLVVTRGEGNDVVKAFRSDADGMFQVAVGPGTYGIRRPPGSSMPPMCGTSDPVVVTAGHVASVRVDCDTGIR